MLRTDHFSQIRIVSALDRVDRIEHSEIHHCKASHRMDVPRMLPWRFDSLPENPLPLKDNVS